MFLNKKTPPENINFEAFKNDFYSRVHDLGIFDFGNYNALKIVLDGLKVNYVERFKSRASMFYPLWLIRWVFFLKYNKHKKGSFDVKELASDKTILLVDCSGRYSTSDTGNEVSFYFNKIIRELGNESLHHISLLRLSSKVQYSMIYNENLFAQYSRITPGQSALRRSLMKLYKTVKKSGIFKPNELENIRISLSSFFKQVNHWNVILDQMPFLKKALIEMHYHNEALIYCLKERNIEVVEIQHGLISTKDIFYVFPAAISEIVPRALFPDKILVVGQYWKDILLKGAEYAARPDSVIVLGNYYSTSTALPDEQKKELSRFTGSSGVILFTTQTLMHDDFIPYIKWLSGDLLQKALDYKILVKIHPNEKMENYQDIHELGNVMVTQANLYYLFSIANIHISIYSTTLYDALEFNLPNFSLACDYAEDYRSEILKDGIALPINPFENPVELLSGAQQPAKTDPSYYYANFDQYKSKLLSLTNPMSMHVSQQCSQCLLSSADTEVFSLDEKGICNYCNYYKKVVSSLGAPEDRGRWLPQKIEEIKQKGRNKPYDCILGVSGGVDSSFLAYWAKQNGLRPLIVHFDNGWNSELAVKNIQTLCEKLNFALQTYVIDWEEFKQLQLAYLRAGVIDVEALTDHAIYATIYRIAKKYGIKYTINGFNYATEAIMPKGWVFDKTDFNNIRDINKKFGQRRIRTYPHVTFFRKMWYSFFLKIESIQALNYINYNKREAKSLLVNELGWLDYGGKHYESVFTKFYQAYILPVKFGVDKRKAHLSNLICSGQMSREAALQELEKPLYDPLVLKEEKEYVLKKLGLPEAEFDKIMREKPRKHTDFKTQKKLWDAYFRLIRLLRPWKGNQ